MSDSNRLMINAGSAYRMALTVPDPEGDGMPMPIFERSVSGWLHGVGHIKSAARRRTLQQWMREASDSLEPGRYRGVLTVEFDGEEDHEVSLMLHGQRETTLTLTSDDSVLVITDYEEDAP